jgi:hypothetical protein
LEASCVGGMSKFDHYWGVRYFYPSTGAWYGMRIYPDAERAVEDVLKLARNPNVGAVRLYDSVYARRDAFVWSVGTGDSCLEAE